MLLRSRGRSGHAADDAFLFIVGLLEVCDVNMEEHESMSYCSSSQRFPCVLNTRTENQTRCIEICRKK